MNNKKELNKQDCNTLKKNFMKENYIKILILLTIPLFFIGGTIYSYSTTDGTSEDVAIETVNFLGFNLSNGLALLASMIAVIGMFYSNHYNEKRNERNTCEANNRLVDQLNTQIKNLETQISKQDERLEKQLKSQEKQLEKQLLYDKEQEAMLKLYEKLLSNRKTIMNNINEISHEHDPEKWTKEFHSIINARHRLYEILVSFHGDISTFRYFTEKTKKLIFEMIDSIKKSYRIDHKDIYDFPSARIIENIKFGPEDKEIIVFYYCEIANVEKYFTDLYKIAEEYINVPFKTYPPQ